MKNCLFQYTYPINVTRFKIGVKTEGKKSGHITTSTIVEVYKTHWGVGLTESSLFTLTRRHKHKQTIDYPTATLSSDDHNQTPTVRAVYSSFTPAPQKDGRPRKLPCVDESTCRAKCSKSIFWRNTVEKYAWIPMAVILLSSAVGAIWLKIRQVRRKRPINKDDNSFRLGKKSGRSDSEVGSDNDSISLKSFSPHSGVQSSQLPQFDQHVLKPLHANSEPVQLRPSLSSSSKGKGNIDPTNSLQDAVLSDGDNNSIKTKSDRIASSSSRSWTNSLGDTARRFSGLKTVHFSPIVKDDLSSVDGMTDTASRGRASGTYLNDEASRANSVKSRIPTAKGEVLRIATPAKVRGRKRNTDTSNTK